MRHRSVRIPLLALLLLGSACMDYTIHDKPEVPPPPPEVTCEFCENEALFLPPGCTAIDCGHLIGQFYNAEVAPVIDESGAVCDLVYECEGDPCIDEWQACINAGNPASECDQVFEDCETRNNCDIGLLECYAEADQWYAECEHDECDWWYCYRRLTCECEYEECLTGHNLDCGALGFEGGAYDQCDGAAPPPLPLVQTGPQRWTVGRKLIGAELERLDRHRVLNPSWPQQDGQGTWVGLRLGHVEAQDLIWQLGSRADDLLTEINGVSVIEILRDPTNIFSLMQADAIHVKLRRKGKSLIHRYDLVD